MTADRKQVMSWLEGLAEDDWRDNHSDSEVQYIAKAALELLKEREPVEPKKESNGKPDLWKTWWYICGECCGDIDYHDKFCRYCGKPVKWNA